MFMVQTTHGVIRPPDYPATEYPTCVWPSLVLHTRSPTPATIIIAACHVAPATCTPRDKQTRFSKQNKINVQPSKLPRIRIQALSSQWLITIKPRNLPLGFSHPRVDHASSWLWCKHCINCGPSAWCHQIGGDVSENLPRQWCQEKVEDLLVLNNPKCILWIGNLHRPTAESPDQWDVPPEHLEEQREHALSIVHGCSLRASLWPYSQSRKQQVMRRIPDRPWKSSVINLALITT
jgi:hypothetical protein